MRIALLATTTIFTLIGFKSFCCCCGKGWGMRQGGGQRESVACFLKGFFHFSFSCCRRKSRKNQRAKAKRHLPRSDNDWRPLSFSIASLPFSLLLPCPSTVVLPFFCLSQAASSAHFLLPPPPTPAAVAACCRLAAILEFNK